MSLTMVSSTEEEEADMLHIFMLPAVERPRSRASPAIR